MKRIVVVTNGESHGGPALVAHRVCQLLGASEQCELIVNGAKVSLHSEGTSRYRVTRQPGNSLKFLHSFVSREVKLFEDTVYIGFGTKQSVLLCLVKAAYNRRFKLLIRTGLNSDPRIEKKGNFFKDYLQLPLCRRLYLLADGLITETVSMREWWVAQGAPSLRVRAINNPVKKDQNPSRSDVLKAKSTIASASPVLICVGRLSFQKNHAFMIEAFARYVRKFNDKSAVLLILGTGPELGRLRQLIQNYELGDRVKLVGHVGNIRPFLERAHLYCLTSRWEGGVNSLIEALHYELPILALDCPVGPKDILRSMPGTAVVAKKDATIFADEINALLTACPPGTGYARILDKYTDRAITESYFNFISEVV